MTCSSIPALGIRLAVSSFTAAGLSARGEANAAGLERSDDPGLSVRHGARTRKVQDTEQGEEARYKMVGERINGACLNPFAAGEKQSYTKPK